MFYEPLLRHHEFQVQRLPKSCMFSACTIVFVFTAEKLVL